MNDVLNELTYYLWRDKLNLNSSKTKFLEQKAFKKLVELSEESVLEIYSPNYLIDKIISDKIKWLLNNEGEKLIEFIKKLRKCYNYYSVDLALYHKYINDYIAVDGNHATKVINNLIYGKKWKLLRKNTLLKLIVQNSYVFFNPMQFTTFFFMMINHLKMKNYDVDNDFKKFIKILNDKEKLTFREGDYYDSIFSSNEEKRYESNKKMKNINKDYVDFLEEFYD